MRTRLGVEPLESRLLLAVRASVQGGDLVVKGSADNACIEIFQAGNETVVQSCDPGTPLVFTTRRFDDDLKIKIRGRDNEIFIEDVRVPDELDVYLSGGAGHTLALEAVRVGGDATIELHDGSSNDVNEIELIDVVIGDDLTIETDDAADHILAIGVRAQEVDVETNDGDDEVVVIDSRFSDDVDVDLGDDDDFICVTGSEFDDDVDVDGGDGDDVAGDDGTNDYEEDPELEDFEDFFEGCAL